MAHCLLTRLPLLACASTCLAIRVQSRTVKDLEVEIENMGGHLNAYTSREQVRRAGGRIRPWLSAAGPLRSMYWMRFPPEAW